MSLNIIGKMPNFYLEVRMRYFKRFLCLLLALTMIGAALASCGGGGEPADTNDNGVTTGGDTTTAPTTTAPTTTVPVTDPPATNPPETVPPCEVHTFASGSKCTDERTCTVCQETVPAGEHKYSDLPCTIARKCLACGDVLAAAADHVYAPAAACGTQKCQNCTTANYGTGCRRNDWADPCQYCGLHLPDFMPFLSIDGISIENFTIVIPTYERNQEYDYEYHLGSMIRHKVCTMDRTGRVKLEMVSDSTERKGPEIRIGKTNRTVTACDADQYIIRVVGEDLEILCGEMYSFDGLMTKIEDLIKMREDGVILAAGEDITERFTPLETDTLVGDLRIMFHNIYQYENARPVDLRTRYGFYKKLYTHYKPDVIGMQEASASYWAAGKGYSIRMFLQNSGYRAINFGDSQVIWYNRETVELLDNTSLGTNSRNNWAIFRQKGEGNEDNIFGVISIHLRANSVADSAEQANQFRVEDAKKVNLSKSEMLAYAKKAGVKDADNLPIFAGGDYNCRVTDDPITTEIMKTGNGLYNIRDVIQDKSKVDDYVAAGPAPIWNQEFDYNQVSHYASTAGSGFNSIDHLYVYAEGVQYTANQYRVIRSLTSRGCADHAPHYVDISFK